MPELSFSEQLRQPADPADALQDEYGLSDQETRAVLQTQQHLDADTYRLLQSALETAYMTGREHGQTDYRLHH